MEALRNFAKKFPLIMALIMLVIAWCGVMYFDIPVEGDAGDILKEIILAVVAAIIAILFIRTDFFKPSAKGCKYAAKKSIYYAIVFIGVFGFVLFLFAVLGKAMYLGQSVDLFVPCLLALIMAVSVGVFEELVFRVFIFGGLVAAMGKTRAGIVGAAIISALVFGFIHVAGTVFSGDPLTADQILAVIGKTLGSSIIGIFCAAIYLKTRNFWFIAGLHALNDFFGLWIVYTGVAQIGDYASGATSSNAMYLIQFILGIPVIVMSIKMLLKNRTPEPGPLCDDHFLPCNPVEEKKPRHRR